MKKLKIFICANFRSLVVSRCRTSVWSDRFDRSLGEQAVVKRIDRRFRGLEILELYFSFQSLAILISFCIVYVTRRRAKAFDPATVSAQREKLTPEQRRAAEHRFLGNFMYMMEKANYKVLSRSELEFAEAEQVEPADITRSFCFRLSDLPFLTV
jgi:hypothetical protein